MKTGRHAFLMVVALAIGVSGFAQRPAPYAFPAFEGKATVPVVKVSSGRVIHRFFDTSPLSPSGRYLALFRFPQEITSPKPGEVGEVVLVDRQTGKEESIVNIFLSKAGGEFRIDAHPAWDRSGRYVIFNGFLDGTRNVFMADLKGEVDAVKMYPSAGN